MDADDAAPQDETAPTRQPVTPPPGPTVTPPPGPPASTPEQPTVKVLAVLGAVAALLIVVLVAQSQGNGESEPSASDGEADARSDCRTKDGWGIALDDLGDDDYDRGYRSEIGRCLPTLIADVGDQGPWDSVEWLNWCMEGKVGVNQFADGAAGVCGCLYSWGHEHHAADFPEEYGLPGQPPDDLIDCYQA